MRSPIRSARAAFSAAALLFIAACAADGPLNPSDTPTSAQSEPVDSAPRGVVAAAVGSNQAPVAWISKPAQGASSAQGASIAFSGNAFDAEDGQLNASALVWSSSRDGQIGTGKSFTKNNLSVGSHTITLTAKDAAGATFSHNRTITITGVANTAPTASISAPTNTTSVTAGTSVSFAGTGADPQDGTLAGASLVWTSSRDGQIGTGIAFSTSSLTVGSHTITLTATDGQSATGAATRTVTVTASNQAPTAGITTPGNNASVVQGASVSFAGTGNDPESGALSGAALVWTSSRDGQIGTGASFSKSNLTVGSHTITLTATDALGAADTDTRVITVTAPAAGPNEAPMGLIATPAHNAEYPQGASVSFTGSGTDPEDGALTGASLVWTSSRDGQIGTGTSFTKSNLSIGWHTISLTSKDAQGATFVHNRMLNITAAVANQAPTAGITAPANNSSVAQGANVSFAGTGGDAESGALTGTALVWTSSRDGQIGTGTSFSKSNLSAGTHTITLTAKDPQNAVGTATRTITVSSPTNQPPTAGISAPGSNATYVQGASVSFAGSGTDTESGTLSGASLVWTSSRDGQIGTGTSFTKTNLSVGSHTITLTAKDAQNATGVATRTISVTAPANQAPVANFTISCVLLVCNFDAASSSDNAGIVQYAWNWGSGVVTKTVPLISNTFLVVGTVNITLTVTDAAGLTSSITKSVSLTSGSTGGSSAEPTGMTMLADRAFNCIQASSCGEGGWYYDGAANAATLVSDATAPKSGSNVVQQNFMSSLPGGSSPASLGTGISAKKTIYVSMWMKLSSNFQGHPTSTNKVVHLYIDGSNRAYTMVRGSGSGTLVPSFGLQGLAAPYTHIDESGKSVTSESVNLVPNVGTKNIIRGQWHRYEIVMVANTAGVANGSAEMWVDGVKVISNTGIMFTGSGAASMWQEVNWSPTWGGGGGSISSTFTASMDHMYISGK